MSNIITGLIFILKGLFLLMKKNWFNSLIALALILLFCFSPFTVLGDTGEETPAPPAAPVVTGVVSGENYNTPVTVTWEDAEGTTSTAVLSINGEEGLPFANGTEIAEDGSYVLTVTAIDKGTSLTAATVVEFTLALDVLEEEEQREQPAEEIKPLPPEVPVIKGVEDKGIYNAPVAADWEEPAGVTSEATISRNRLKPAPYSRGEIIDKSGTYILDIEFTDTITGLSTSTSLSFVVAIEQQDIDLRSLTAGRINAMKAALEPDKRKLSTKLLQLIDEEFLPPGESEDEIKQQMINNKQMAMAGQRTRGGEKAADDLVYVYINLEEGVNSKLIEPYSFKIENYNQKYGLAAAWVETSKLEKLASLPGVLSIQPVVPPITKAGSVESEGYEKHRVNELWDKYGQGGAGVKIGVISDGVDSWIDAADTGDLPMDLVVLSNSQGGDEGTAMLEIIHDLAPEAQLYFHDCGSNVLAFIEAINNLKDAGCDIIVDDICWVYEPFFDDGIIASHISTLTDDLVYISSAGNSGGFDNSAHYQGEYYEYGSTGWHDFSSGTSQYTELYAQIPSGGELWTILQWDDPFANSVGNSTNDYDLYLFDVTDEENPEFLDYSMDSQEGAGYAPLEYIYYVNNTGTALDVAVSVIKAEPEHEGRTLEIYMYTRGSGTYISPENIKNEDSIFGHPAVEDVIAVGAVNQSTPEQIASYSSRGPVTMRGGTTRSKPDVVGIDGVSVTGAGIFPSTFFGTSAAAPHVAAMAALIKSYFPTAAPEEIRSMIFETAFDLGDLGYDYVYGKGRADALNIFDAYDNLCPEYVDFEITDLNSRIVLCYDENIYYTGMDPGELKNQIILTDTEDNVLTITAANIDGRELHIQLEEPLSGLGHKLVLAAGILRDGNANPMEELTVEGIDEDTTPPQYIGFFTGYDGFKTIIYFDEEILANTDELGNYVTCTVDSVSRGCEVEIIDNQMVLTFAQPLFGTDVEILIAEKAIKDTNRNVKDTQTVIDSFDTYPPELQSVVYSVATKTVALNFSEDILNHWNSDELLKMAVKVSIAGASFRELANEDSVEIDGSRLNVSFAQLITENFRISVAAHTLKDISGNILQTPVITGIIEPPPVYIQAEVTNNNSRVSLLFSKDIFSTGDEESLEAAVSYAPDGVTYNGEITDVSINGRYLHIDLLSPLEGQFNKFRVAENTLKDENDNILGDLTETDFIAKDETGPVYQDFSLSGGFTTLALNFNEKIERVGTEEELKAAVTFAADGLNYGSLTENDAVSIDGNSLQISFFSKLVGSDNSVKIEAGALQDRNGNLGNEMTVTGITGASQEARLSGLSLSSGSLTPAFHRDTFEYTATVINVSSIRVTPTSLHSGATVKVNGDAVLSGHASNPISLALGENVISVLVTAEDEQNQKEYTIVVTRKSSSGGGGGGGGGGAVPPPVQPLKPTPPAPILNNTVTEDDKKLEKSLQEIGVALLDLTNDSDGMATLSPGILTQLSAKNKPLHIDSDGIKLQFYPNSLITQ